jgi:dephospho-CoA kinase
LFEKQGARVIDADEIGKEVVEKNPDVLSAIVKTFGRRILRRDGTLDRRELGRLVFYSSDNLETLNRLVHPFLIQEIGERITALERGGYSGIVVVDAALVYEWNLVEMFDAIVVVSCSQDAQLERIRERDSLEADEALSRIRSQIPQEHKIARADFHIANDGSLRELASKAGSVWTKLNALLRAKGGGKA